MLKFIIAPVLTFVVIIFGLGIFLQPDDIASCKNPDTSASCQPVDAIVAVSGGDTSARAEQAIKLYNEGWSKLIIFSGAAVDKTGPSNAAVMKSLAIKSGIPETSIIIDDQAETTKQNAMNTTEIIKQNSIHRIILTTSGYHQRRALLEFQKRAGNGVKILNAPVHTDKDWSGWWWLTINGWWLALSEFIKIIFFYTFGVL